MGKTQTIFWDFNGTLLNDTEISIQAMNTLLSERSMKQIDEDKYKAIFGFPVKEYYSKLGFTFEEEKFEDVSAAFIGEYNKLVADCGLHVGVHEVISHFQNRGCKQVIISAMEQRMLEKLLEKNQIQQHFHAINGLQDIHANGKVHIAKDYITQNSLNSENILFIGDTLHDAEVAKSIGCELVLVSNGHNSYERLIRSGYKVIADLNGLLGCLIND